MVQKDLILDFNLYLCEKFGYRESCSVMQNANGFCVDIRERDLDCYIRFWEYSCGRGNFPDWSIIIVRSNFKKNQEESLKDLARFFKEYTPRYGYGSNTLITFCSKVLSILVYFSFNTNILSLSSLNFHIQ